MIRSWPLQHGRGFREILVKLEACRSPQPEPPDRLEWRAGHLLPTRSVPEFLRLGAKRRAHHWRSLRAKQWVFHLDLHLGRLQTEERRNKPVGRQGSRHHEL